MTYEEWNQRLADCFFNASHAGRRVYLHTTAELLTTLAGDGNGSDDFVRAVKQGPAGIQGSLCAKALAARERWSDRSRPPPFLAHLCLFAFAATREGNWASHAYYPRLWDVLEEPGWGAPPDFPRMKSLWRELELWSHADAANTLGYFKAQAAGKWIHVGLPIAQAILTDGERRYLLAIFDEADLEPGANLAAEEIAAAVAAHAGGRLRRRTMDLLRSTGSSEFRAELLQLLQLEVAEWNGAKEPLPSDPEQESRRAGIRIWLKHIDPSGFVDARLIAKLPDDIEAADIALVSPRFPQSEFACLPGSANLSEPLYAVQTGTELGAETLPWLERTEFHCRTTGTRFVLPPARVRVFVSGADDGVQGFMEVRIVPSAGEFFIAVAPHEAASMSQWGAEFCDGWREQLIYHGLPAGWRLFQGANARGDGGLGSRLPVLSRPAAPRIRFEGGIHCGTGARYFPFALPVIAVDWPEVPRTVSCNGSPLVRGASGRYEIPASMGAPICHIDVQFADREAHDLLFTVSDGWRWGDGSECVPINQFGLPPARGEIDIRGADTGAAVAPDFAADPATAVDNAENAVWIGKIPGQIADERRGYPLPTWAPVWVVTFRRQLVQFAYCGTSLASAAPESGRTADAVKKWKAVVWGTRKRTASLRNPKLQELLRRYRDAANAL